MNTNRKSLVRSASFRAAFDLLESRKLMAATPMLDYSTYFGAGGSDTALAITSDAAGNTYVAGSTTSSAFAKGGYDTVYSGGSFSGDAIVAKFGANGKLAWSSYLGNGFSLEEGSAIKLDKDGNVYVAGQSSSTGWTEGGYDTSYGGGAADGFVAKFSNSGALAWSTYVGGAKDDQIFDMHVSSKGVVTVVGETTSTDLPGGGFDKTANGGTDGFVTRISTKGAHLATSYIGGAKEDRAHGVTMGIDGSIFVVGETTSDTGFISGGQDTSYGAFIDGFVMQIKPDGTKGWSTYLGGDNFDIAKSVAVAGDGQLIIAGMTGTSGWTSGGFDTSYNGGGDGVVVRMTAAGQTVWSTYFGGDGNDEVKDLAIASDGTIAIVGGTGGGSWAVGGPITSDQGGIADGFAIQLTGGGQHKWSTFTGGAQTDYNFGVAFDAQDRMLVSGFTDSSGWTGGGADSTYGGNTDGFIARYSAFEPFATKTNDALTIQGTDNADVIDLSRKGNLIFVTRNGVTQKISASGVSRVEVFANAGNDRVILAPTTPATYVHGGAGNDYIQGGDGADSLTGAAGKDTLLGGNGDDRLNGSAGHDRVFGEVGFDRLYGDAGNDFLDGGGNGDRLWGGEGDDSLAGGSSNDKLYGGAGNDFLTGGKGTDYLFGDDGTDTSPTDSTDIRDAVEIVT